MLISLESQAQITLTMIVHIQYIYAHPIEEIVNQIILGQISERYTYMYQVSALTTAPTLLPKQVDFTKPCLLRKWGR